MTPVAKTGLHCGGRRPSDLTAEEVTPVAKTGLHCGQKFRAAITAGEL